MHGIPIWQRRPGDRLYLLGADYGGADGFIENGRYYMHQRLSGAVYASDRFGFDDVDQVRPSDPLVPYVTSALARATEGQLALIARVRQP
jgi:hypothetical protein